MGITWKRDWEAQKKRMLLGLGNLLEYLPWSIDQETEVGKSDSLSRAVTKSRKSGSNDCTILKDQAAPPFWILLKKIYAISPSFDFSL